VNYLAIVPLFKKAEVQKNEYERAKKEEAAFWGVANVHLVTSSGEMPLSTPGNNTGKTNLDHRTPSGGSAKNPLLKYPPLLTPDGVAGENQKRIEFAAGLKFDLYDGGDGGNANCLAVAILLATHFANKGAETPVSKEEIERKAAALRIRAHNLMREDLIAIKTEFREQLQNYGLRPVDIQQIINGETVPEKKIRNILSDNPAYVNMNRSTKIKCERTIDKFQLAIGRVHGLLNDDNRPDGGSMMDTEFGGCMARDLGTDVLVIDCDHLDGRKHPCHYFSCNIGKRVEATYNHDHEWHHEDEPERLGRYINRGQPLAVIFRFPGHFITGNYVGSLPLPEPSRSEKLPSKEEEDTAEKSKPSRSDTTSDKSETRLPTPLKSLTSPHPNFEDVNVEEKEDEMKSMARSSIPQRSDSGPGGDNEDPNNPPSSERDVAKEPKSPQPTETPGSRSGISLPSDLGPSGDDENPNNPPNSERDVAKEPKSPQPTETSGGSEIPQRSNLSSSGDSANLASSISIPFEGEDHPFVPASSKKKKAETKQMFEEREELMRKWGMTPPPVSSSILSRRSSSETSSGRGTPHVLSPISPFIPHSGEASEHSQNEAKSMARSSTPPVSRLSYERKIGSEGDSADNPELSVKKIDEEKSKEVLPNDKTSGGMRTRNEKGRRKPPARDVNKQLQGLSPQKPLPKNRK
jgi:hypothetical protein